MPNKIIYNIMRTKVLEHTRHASALTVAQKYTMKHFSVTAQNYRSKIVNLSLIHI